MKIITCLSDSENFEFNNYLLPSCKRHGLELVVLKFKGKYKSHRVKDHLLMEYLEGLDASELVFFTDAYDTCFLSDQEEIIEKFETKNCDLLFSAEVNCWPCPILSVLYEPAVHHFKYLNSGGFIGKAGFIRYLLTKHTTPPIKKCFSNYLSKDFYEEIKKDAFTLNKYYKWSNQYYWHLLYLNYKEQICIDHTCDIFYTFSTNIGALNNIDRNLLTKFEEERISREVDFVNTRIHSKLTRTSPSHLHFTGPIPKSVMRSTLFEHILSY